MSYNLNVIDATPENFKRFGFLLEKPEREPDGGDDTFNWWRDVINYQLPDNVFYGFLECFPQDKKTVSKFERHLNTSETLVVLEGDVILALVEADNEKEEPDLDKLSAVRVKQGTVAVLGKGVWHFAPIPVDKVSRVMVIFEKDTDKNDLYLVDLKEQKGIEYEIV
ncbi:MAG: ureidoglycolate lyase [Clostridia bacterium]|nr:ureidoglycolate lyase [Clostridia bacterium]